MLCAQRAKTARSLRQKKCDRTPDPNFAGKTMRQIMAATDLSRASVYRALAT